MGATAAEYNISMFGYGFLFFQQPFKLFLDHHRHTLWKRIQAVVVPILAQLVSVIDRDQNLDILLDSNCGESVKRLWLDIFGNEKLLEIPHLTVDHK